MIQLKTLLARFKKSKDASTVAKNFGYLTAMQIAGYVFPLLTIPYLARVIGVDKFGEIAFAAAIVLWFKTVSEWGFNYTATRDIAKNRDNKEAVSQIFSNVLWARLFLGSVSFVLLYAAIELVPYLQDKKLLLLLTFLTVPADIFLPQWFFQGLERMKFITVFSVLTKLLFTVGVFVFIKEKDDFILQPLLFSAGALVAGCVSLYLILIRWEYSLRKPEVRNVITTLKNSTDVFINTIAPNLYFGFSTILVGMYAGAISNGLLDAGRKFVDVAQSFMGLLSKAFFPFLARRGDQHKNYVKVTLVTACFASISLVVMSDFIIKLFFTPEFYKAVIVLQISSLSLIFLAIRDIYGVNYLILRGYEKSARNITVSTSVIGFIAAFPLVIYFHHVGAAVLVVLIHLLQALLMYFKYCSIENISKTKG